jgi:hypothetical protein
MEMLNSTEIAELRLSGNRLLKFHYHPRNGSLFVELQAPTTKRDGHGFGFVDGVTLQGPELAAFAEAIGALQEPELLPAPCQLP